MKQILNIFRTDTRHFWPEITISFAVVAAFALSFPIGWRPHPIGEMGRVNDLAIFKVFIPATWWLMIARLIHSESLVGERQFWLTRPYEWKKLMAAKLLFLAVWLYVPLLLAQCLVLAEAGFHPLPYTSGLLFNLFVESGFMIVPLVALATVTENFARMTLTLLGILAAFIAFGLLIPGSKGYDALPTHHHLVIYPAILLVFCAAAVVLQYAARTVWRARVLLLATVVLVIAASSALAHSRQDEVSREYTPLSSAAAAPLQIAFAPDPRHPLKLLPSERPGMVYIEIPLQYTGIPKESVVQPDNVRFSVSAPGGFQWTAPWWASYQWRYYPGEHHAEVQIMMSRELYDRLKSVPITLQLTLAITQLNIDKVAQVAAQAEDFDVPGFGVCSPHDIFFRAGLTCRMPLRDPALTHIETTWSADPCLRPQPSADTALRGDGWTGSAYPDQRGFQRRKQQQSRVGLDAIYAAVSRLSRAPSSTLTPALGMAATSTIATLRCVRARPSPSPSISPPYARVRS